MKFCLDANVFITAYNGRTTHYPYRVFPSLWQQLVKHKTELILLKGIYDEIGIKELQDFIDNHQVEKQDIDPSVKKNCFAIWRKIRYSRNRNRYQQD